MSEFKRKFKTCERLRTDLGWGTILGLLGCVTFWNLRKSKVVRRAIDNLRIMRPETLDKLAWVSTISFKAISAGYYIKGLLDYKKC